MSVLEGEGMSNGNGNNESRLDTIESILQNVATRLADLTITQEQFQRDLAETRAIADRTLQIAESNSRSIQAWESRIEENRDESEEERSELRVNMSNLSRNLDRLQANVDELVQLARRNEVEHELFRLRFEAIDPLTNGE